MTDTTERSAAMPSEYDRRLGLLDGGQSVTHTRPTQTRIVPPLGVGGSTSYSITTYREAGDILEEDTTRGTVKRAPAKYTTFMEVARGNTNHQIVIPDEVFAIMARQRDSLATQAARAAGRAHAASRKARGIAPAFLKAAKARRRKGGK